MAVWLWPSIAAWLLRSCLGDGPGDGGRGQARGQPGQASIAAGAYCSFAIGADGELYGWGKNEFGKLGLGDEEDRLIPSKLNLRATAITAGRHHAVAIDESGRLWTWGSNQNGQLGAGDEVQSLALPHELFASGATQVASGARHNLAVVHGQLYSWGWNSNGQLGRSGSGSSPAQVDLNGVVAVAAGFLHSLALRADQSLWAWGTNGKGQMGTGQADHGSHTPVQILASGVTSIAAMDETSFAVYDGFLFGVGLAGSPANQHIASAVKICEACEVMAGGLAHSLLLYEDQSLWAVGHDAHGGLGSRLGGDFATTPVQVFEAGAIRPFNRSAFAFAPGSAVSADPRALSDDGLSPYTAAILREELMDPSLRVFRRGVNSMGDPWDRFAHSGLDAVLLLLPRSAENVLRSAETVADGRGDPCGMLKGLNAQLRFRILRGDETAWAEVARSAEGATGGRAVPPARASRKLRLAYSQEDGRVLARIDGKRFLMPALERVIGRKSALLALLYTYPLSGSAVSATLTFEHLGSTWTIHAHDNELHVTGDCPEDMWCGFGFNKERTGEIHGAAQGNPTDAAQMAGADVFTFGHHQGTDLPDCPMTCGTGCGCGCGTRRLSAPKNPFIPRVRDLKIQLPKPFTTPGAAHKLDQVGGVVGVAMNSVLFVNEHPEEGMTWLFDNCGGHGDTYGHYHYHAPPLCLLKSLGVPVPKKSAWWKSAGAAAWPEHGPEVQIGWALDGAPIMGPFKGGVRTEKKLLDECHGAFDELTGEYRYYLLPSAPYMPPCLRGAQLGNVSSFRSRKDGEPCSKSESHSMQTSIMAGGKHGALVVAAAAALTSMGLVPVHVDAVPLVDVGAALLQPDVDAVPLAAAGAALLQPDVDAVPLVDVGAALLQPDVGVARLAAAGAALLIQPDVGAVRLAAAGVARLAAAGVARLVAAGWGEWADGRSASEEYSLTFENGRMKVSAHRAFNTGDPTDYVLDMDSDTQYYVLLTVGQSIKVGYHGNSRTQTLVCVSTLSTKGLESVEVEWKGGLG
ncbi:unnamed protein product [Durusdinium trenchii]|uniref:YHYH domain-containing protein n=1 Tax=Durusdinium trenchii TaxID=1381693 RepID=A0ABP0NKA3_9DINO